MLSCDFACCQSPAKRKVDTLSLYPFQSVQLKTNNGTACTCYIGNPSNANIVSTVSVGAPDSLKFDDNTFFNGIHRIEPGRQLIAVGNFMGKQLSIVNFSPMHMRIIVAIYCPGN